MACKYGVTEPITWPVLGWSSDPVRGCIERLDSVGWEDWPDGSRIHFSGAWLGMFWIQQNDEVVKHQVFFGFLVGFLRLEQVHTPDFYVLRWSIGVCCWSLDSDLRWVAKLWLHHCQVSLVMKGTRTLHEGGIARSYWESGPQLRNGCVEGEIFFETSREDISWAMSCLDISWAVELCAAYKRATNAPLLVGD